MRYDYHRQRRSSKSPWRRTSGSVGLKIAVQRRVWEHRAAEPCRVSPGACRCPAHRKTRSVPSLPRNMLRCNGSVVPMPNPPRSSRVPKPCSPSPPVSRFTDAAHAAGRKSGDAVAHLVARFNREGLAAADARTRRRSAEAVHPRRAGAHPARGASRPGSGRRSDGHLVADDAPTRACGRHRTACRR